MVPPVVINATGRQTASIIFMHGLGDTGNGWASTIADIKPSYAKCICPTAPTVPVTLNMGMRMPSWFDLMTLEPDGPEDSEGIKKAAQTVHELIADEERRGVPSDRILLGGFSQGGALALYSALKYPKKLAGVLALSCWMPIYKEVPGSIVGNRDTKILHCHGDADFIVPFRWGQATHALLRQHLNNYSFKSYKGLGHSSCPEEMRDMKEFIANCLPPI